MERFKGSLIFLTAPFISFSRVEWEEKRDEIIKRLLQELVWPVFVKPAHLGSSVGVHKVVDREDLISCINDAFRFDTLVLVENGIHGREIEFSVLGNDDVVAFPPGEVCSSGKVYDYQGKYGTNAMQTLVQAQLSDEQIERGKKIAKKAYQAAGCQGMARVDTFLDSDGTYWLNEINPIPGFTKNSLYPLMCAAHGLSGKELVNRLIILGLQRKCIQDKLELKDSL
jgi:UDP-N-acetylmuramate--alanine ligase